MDWFKCQISISTRIFFSYIKEVASMFVLNIKRYQKETDCGIEEIIDRVS